MPHNSEINTHNLSTAIMAELTLQSPNAAAKAQVMNACIRAANMIADECTRSAVKALPGMTVQQWFECDEVGSSSKYMALKMDGGTTRLPFVGYEYPRDADDFGRCLGLVRACGFEDRVKVMHATGAEWAAITVAWDRLVALYESDNISIFHEYLTSLTEFFNLGTASNESV